MRRATAYTRKRIYDDEPAAVMERLCRILLLRPTIWTRRQLGQADIYICRAVAVRAAGHRKTCRLSLRFPHFESQRLTMRFDESLERAGD